LDSASSSFKNHVQARSDLFELVAYFIKLGSTAFGGPAAHIAMMHDGLVTRKQWLTDQEFLDLVSATNLIPGPNSTELAIHVGYRRAGWRGLIAAGVAFILPAMLIVMALAWAYVEFGTTPQAEALFYGIQPVVIVIIAQALWLLGRKAVKNPLTAFVGVAVLGLYLVGAPELLLLLAAGLIVMLFENAKRFKPILPAAWLPLGISPLLGLMVTSFSLPLLFFTFLKIGAVLYAAVTSCSPFSMMISSKTLAGSPSSNCWTPSPSGRSPPDQCSPLPPLSGSCWAACPARSLPPSGFSCPRSCSWRLRIHSSRVCGNRRCFRVCSTG